MLQIIWYSGKGKIKATARNPLLPGFWGGNLKVRSTGSLLRHWVYSVLHGNHDAWHDLFFSKPAEFHITKIETWCK